MKIRTLLGAVALAGTLAFGSVAQAAVLTLEFQGFKNGSRSGELTVNGTGLGTIQAGMFDFKVTNIDGDPEISVFDRILAFCLEADVLLVDPAVYDLLSASDYFNDATRLARIEQLFAQFLGETGTAEKDAAFQLALWELVYDGDGDLESGDFIASGYGSSLGIAQGWLDTLGSGQSFGLWALRSDGQYGDASQDLIVWVPEPGTLALLGMALIGFGAARRMRVAR